MCNHCQGAGELYAQVDDQGTIELRTCSRCHGHGFEKAHASPKSDPSLARLALRAAVQAFERFAERAGL